MKRLINSATLKLTASIHGHCKQNEKTRRRYLLICNLKDQNQVCKELYIYKKKTHNPLKKWAKVMNRHFAQKEKWVTNE